MSLVVRTLITNLWFQCRNCRNSLGTLNVRVLFQTSLPFDRRSILLYKYNYFTTDVKQSNTIDSPVIVKRENVKEHLERISKILNCSVDEVVALCLKHKFLYDMSLDTLYGKVQLLLSYGIPYSVIHTNLRAVWYVSAETLKKRLQLLQKLDILDYRFAGFYLHCTQREFIRGIKHVSRYQEALEGCSDQLEYLQYRLQISESKAKKLLLSSPFQRGYSPLRLKRQLDFFLDEAEVSPEYLVEHFLLFNYSAERLRHRLKIMKKVGIKDSELWKKIWRMTPTEFNESFGNDIDSANEC